MTERSQPEQSVIDALIAHMHQQRYGHMERRFCTADAPMPMEQKDVFRWSHPDAQPVRPFFNLMIYECPHCKLTFHALPPITDPH